MNKKIISIIVFCLLFFVVVATPVLAATSMFDQMAGSVTKITNYAFGGGKTVTVTGFTFRDSLIFIVNSLLTFVGLVFFLMIIYSGYLWMTAKGNDEQIEKAKELMKELIIGLIIIIMSRIITEFVLTNIGTITK
ncbi:MAG: hypothetical protein WCX71_01875 [Candidatus Buchananbacteria bacterium]